MDNKGGKRDTGPFVALGAYVGVPPRRVHRRVVVIDAGDGFRTMTLAAGKPGPTRVKVQGLSRMALDAGEPVIEPESLVRVGQVCSAANGRGRWS